MAKIWLVLSICLVSFGASGEGLRFLTSQELLRLPPKTQKNYFMAQQAYFMALEKIWPTAKKRVGLRTPFEYLLGEAIALQTGDSCVTGGSISTWGPDGCKRAETCELNGQPNAGVRCNANVYLTSNCVQADEPGRYCHSAFAQKYPTPDSLAKDVEARVKAAGVSFDTYVAQLNDFQMSLLFRKDLTAEQQRELDNAVSPLSRVIETARAMTSKGTQTAQAPAALNATGAPAPLVTQPPTASTPDGFVPSATRAKVEEKPLTVPKPKPVPDILGDLTCVTKGLTAATKVQPSARFVALVGVAVQHYEGPFDLNNADNKAQFQRKVIERIQSYGFCDEASYPTQFANEQDIKQVKRWLVGTMPEADRAQKKVIDRALVADPGPDGQRLLADIFGFKQPRDVFDKLFAGSESALERQNNWLKDDMNGHSTAWARCRNDARKRLKQAPFNLQSLAGGAADPAKLEKKTGELDEAFTKRKEAAAKRAESAAKSSARVCETMVKECKLKDVNCAVTGSAGSQSPAPPVDPAKAAN